MKVLVVYSNIEAVPRKTIESFLRSFESYSETVVYLNIIFRYIDPIIRLQNFDLIVFHHSAIISWTRDHFDKRIELIKKICSLGNNSIAFLQDEYFNTDLTETIISECRFSRIYSVAQENQWPIIYPNTELLSFRKCLTGYIDQKDIAIAETYWQKISKKIDIGYRTADFTASHYRLGKLGYLKSAIAEAFLRKKSHLSYDIEIGNSFFYGESWFHFLAGCRFTLGVDSGSLILDRTGKIKNQVEENGVQNFDLFKIEYLDKFGIPINLRAISPRFFEAALLKVGLILVKGEYNGILIPDTHYIPLEEDFSNLDEVILKASDESLRLKLVDNCYNDLIQSGKYSYTNFCRDIFLDLNLPLKSRRKSWLSFYNQIILSMQSVFLKIIHLYRKHLR
jgi:hypothetical protein